MKVVIKRTYGEKQTLGRMLIDGKEFCKTLELPWKQNQRNISCIPEGVYTVVKRPAHAKRKYEHFHILNVPNRTWILIHTGNYYYHILGCVLVGDKHIDMNKDGLLDVANSTVTLNKLVKMLPSKFELTIEKE